MKIELSDIESVEKNPLELFYDGLKSPATKDRYTRILNHRDGRPASTAPKIKFIIGDGVKVEKVGDSKPPKYASNLYRIIGK
ncbi:MAG: hypothetical protein KGI19_09885 [Thaumarchaeota archaeon]|nr:hypothetical protein [Nitrososphaerota archaeon]